ncbi:hypothetical protein BDZ91DRAFT_506477 [Kalaharituber pfeilii]|nr:hypothetical protein BDZ91DRAFT_506477 [Kalaharituber pfeilii]
MWLCMFMAKCYAVYRGTSGGSGTVTRHTLVLLQQNERLCIAFRQICVHAISKQWFLRQYSLNISLPPRFVLIDHARATEIDWIMEYGLAHLRKTPNDLFLQKMWRVLEKLIVYIMFVFFFLFPCCWNMTTRNVFIPSVKVVRTLPLEPTGKGSDVSCASSEYRRSILARP